MIENFWLFESTLEISNCVLISKFLIVSWFQNFQLSVDSLWGARAAGGELVIMRRSQSWSLGTRRRGQWQAIGSDGGGDGGDGDGDGGGGDGDDGGGSDDEIAQGNGCGHAGDIGIDGASGGLGGPPVS